MAQSTTKRAGKLVAVAFGLVLAGLAVTAHHDWENRRVAELGCRTGPLLPWITEQEHRGAFLFPYGTVTSCRVLGGEVGLLSADADTDLLLETRRGLVAVRVAYRDMDRGRQWTAKATELTADQAAHLLSDAEERRLRTSIASRGGVLAEEWTLNYGDG
ncbi:hypothetical protein [Catellatospora vulcania]|uniref:hypothetical protein n=1 Tax=Catellatospora vulcania TaxID=1460450 RepID=UPI0012D455C1|nr:hypothetical protein [Catellatospora vulcania]